MLDITLVTATRKWEFDRAGLTQEIWERKAENLLWIYSKRSNELDFLYLKCRGQLY